MLKIHQAKAVSFLVYSMTRDPIFGVHVSLGSTATLVRRGGIANHPSIAYSLFNISAKNYQNWLMYVEFIVCLLRHSVLPLLK